MQTRSSPSPTHASEPRAVLSRNTWRVQNRPSNVGQHCEAWRSSESVPQVTETVDPRRSVTTVASGSTVCSVYRQAPRSLSATSSPMPRGDGPGASVRGSGGERVLVDVGEARTIGRRLYQIRRSRGKSLRVIAGSAGMSTTQLWRIEHGERALDSLSEIVALADALQIAPSELMRLPVPAPANGHADSAINAVFLALMAARRSRAGGQVVPIEALRARVMATAEAHCRCDRSGEVGAALPSLIRDLHTSIAAGRDVAELLDLAVVLHVNATVGWLRVVAPTAIELREMAAELAFRAAEQRDTSEARGLAVWGGLYVMVTAGAVDLAWAELDSVSVPTRTPEGMQLEGTLALCRSFLAAVDSRPGEVDAPLAYAAELAARTGEINAYGLGFGPQDVGQWRMRALLETGDHESAVRVAEGLRPETHLLRSRQADYWVTYGWSLARLRGRHEDAAKALRRPK